MYRILVTAGLLVMAVAVANADEKMNVFFSGISEVRVKGEVYGESDKPEPGFGVFLRLNGVQQPPRHGQAVVTAATDDLGNNLLLPPSTYLGKMNSNNFNIGTMLVRVDLKPPSRGARRLKTLKGELRLVRVDLFDTKKEVVLTKVKSLCGKTVDHPELTKAGLTVQVGRQGAAWDELSVLITGDGARDVRLEILDAEGNTLTTEERWTEANNANSTKLKLRRPLLDSDAMKVTFLAETKRVTVPFEFKDVELP